eukprot:1144507-Rhodomonas_salina.1
MAWWHLHAPPRARSLSAPCMTQQPTAPHCIIPQDHPTATSHNIIPQHHPTASHSIASRSSFPQHPTASSDTWQGHQGGGGGGGTW